MRTQNLDFISFFRHLVYGEYKDGSSPHKLYPLCCDQNGYLLARQHSPTEIVGGVSNTFGIPAAQTFGAWRDVTHYRTVAFIIKENNGVALTERALEWNTVGDGSGQSNNPVLWQAAAQPGNTTIYLGLLDVYSANQNRPTADAPILGLGLRIGFNSAGNANVTVWYLGMLS